MIIGGWFVIVVGFFMFCCFSKGSIKELCFFWVFRVWLFEDFEGSGFLFIFGGGLGRAVLTIFFAACL